MPAKLRQANFFQAVLTAPNAEVSTAVHQLNVAANQIVQTRKRKKPKNLSVLEEYGLTWLKKMTREDKVSICQADKGGAILLVPPIYLENKIKEKVSDRTCYEELKKDPTTKLHQDLIDLWRYGKSAGFVTGEEAKEIVAITERDNKSTASRFKPGKLIWFLV